MLLLRQRLARSFGFLSTSALPELIFHRKLNRAREGTVLLSAGWQAAPGGRGGARGGLCLTGGRGGLRCHITVPQPQPLRHEWPRAFWEKLATPCENCLTKARDVPAVPAGACAA